MILPTKHLKPDRTLVKLGADIISLTNEPKTVSRIWDEFKKKDIIQKNAYRVPYDWYILTLDFLFTIGAIEFHLGKIRRIKSDI